MAKILIAEDDRMLAEALSRALTAKGCEVIIAANGRIALEQIQEEQPDILLTDMMMPEMDGVALLEKLRADAMLSKIPVIVLSNADDMGTIASALANGGYEYFIKADTELGEIVEHVMKKIAQD